MANNEELIQETFEVQSEVNGVQHSARTLADHIARGKGGREVALAITKLQEAQMWLDAAVRELNPPVLAGDSEWPSSSHKHKPIQAEEE